MVIAGDSIIRVPITAQR